MSTSKNRFRMIGVVLLVGGATVAPARQGPPPPSQAAVVSDLALVEVLETPAVNAASKATKALAEPGPTQFASPYDVDYSPSTAGTWEVLANGDRLWRLRIHAPGATDINLGFGYFWLPEGASLYIYSEDYDYYQGPYTSRDNRDHRQLWTPVVPGERAVVELYLPADTDQEPELWLTRIGRGFLDPFKLSPAKAAKQQSCENDVVCPVGDPWRDQIRSVARYSVSGMFLCTGSLIMDVPQTFRPFFLTAAHCDIDAANDASVVVYWNFESPTCGQLGGGSLSQNQTGSTFLAAKTDVDFCLIELDEIPDLAFNVFYSGWDRSGNPVNSAVGIHHPNADEKAISFTSNPLTTINSCIGFGLSTHWQVNGWNDGATESGSSGSGLWDASSKLLVGTLSGGDSSCFSPQLPDCYGKFSVAWASGSSASTRLKDWLDPGNTGATSVQGSDPPAVATPLLTFPIGGETIEANTTALISWHPNGAPTNSTVEVEFSPCAATNTWVPLGESKPGVTTFLWRVPHLACTGYRVRMKQKADGFKDSDYATSGTFQVTAGGPTALGDFDLDRLWDIVVFEPVTGNWYVRESKTAALKLQNFGFSGVIPVPADYDKDGETDFAVYDPATGNWYILASTDGFTLQNFGYSGTKPAPGDYDADGQTDLGVFEPSTGNWYILGSTDGFSVRNFGFSGVIPVPADYDGDRQTDLAVFYPATGTWYILGSLDGFSAVVLGHGGSVPTPGDFDGDGKADRTVYVPATGNWWTHSSRNDAVRIQQLGYNLTAPVPADFDGDNVCDMAVYEPSTGNWYLLKSSEGFLSQNWGYSGADPALPQTAINEMSGLTP